MPSSVLKNKKMVISPVFVSMSDINFCIKFFNDFNPRFNNTRFRGAQRYKIYNAF